jgi:hypothetical protein
MISPFLYCTFLCPRLASSLHTLLSLDLNPSRQGPFFPCHVTASGHIEPGSSGYMRPGREKAYPFSPPPHGSCCRALDTVSIDTLSFNIVYFACQVGNYIEEYIYFSDMLKHLSFGLAVAMSRALSLPLPHTRYCYEELHAQGQNWGGRDMAGPMFPTRVAGFPWSRSHMTWVLGFFVLFAE